MPIPSNISDLSKVASECSPQGTETVKGTIDDYFRAYGSFIRILSDLVGGPTVVLASAATVNIGFAGSANVSITGTTAITAFDTIAEGTLRWVTFAGALTLTHDAAKLQLPGAANIVTAAGDVAVFKSLGGGNWKCVAYQRVSGTGPNAASATRDGYLTSGDWSTFSGKQPALGYAPVSRTGDSMTGLLEINRAGAGGRSLTLRNNSFAPEIEFAGATGNKYIRLIGSTMEWVNTGYTAGIMTLTDSGVLSAAVVTETSDERKKKCWKRLPADLLQNVARLKKLGHFLWRKDSTPGLGGSAQEIEQFLPWAVHADDKGFKSVRYGAAAFVIVVELTRAFFAHVAKTEKRLAKLEEK